MEEKRPEMSELAANLARELVAERFPDGPMTLEQMEEALAWVKRELGERLQRAWIEQQETATKNRVACGTCAGTARFYGCRERTIVTRHGELHFERRYYACATCHHGFAPLDQRLGLDGHTPTPQVRGWLAELGSEGVFEVAARRLATFTDVHLSESTAARIAVEVGRRLRAEELSEAERILRGEAVPRRTRWQPTRLYVSLDGSMMPLREPWKRDGSLGPLECRYGECKTAVCYETRLDRHGTPVVARRQYTATLEPVETFEKLVAGLAYHCGSDRAQEVSVLADGLAYNWRIAQEYFPEALQILDLYHAVERLHTLARLCLEGVQDPTGNGAVPTPAGWVAARKEQLLNDGVADVCEIIGTLPAPTEEARECRDDSRGYFERNAHRMRYRTFLEAGYQIGSGVMEAACKTVVHQRMDQSGMHWRLENGDAIVALRANQLSHQPRDLHPYCVGWN
jgi:Uncharacterised protein family (UPF0236)